MVFKCISTGCPKPLRSLITIKDHNTLTLESQFCRNKHGDRSFRVMAPKLWNALPIHVRCINPIEKFKPQVKSILLTNYASFIKDVFPYST